ncbi:MAG: extracellular solute-binding protein [Candidatus Poseidoniales archaeon]|nr:MAG: extracellular solute-binding protein [Candidatus Poseidoniales archaeon]
MCLLRNATTFILVLLLLLPGCVSPTSSIEENDTETVSLVVWHSFATESKELATFESQIVRFMASNPGVEVETSAIPFSEAARQFMIAAQGGEAPDVVRLSSDQLGEIGEVRVGGQSLLEDLRPHLTPFERSKFDARALNAMKYDGDLLGIPASQDCLSLIFNPLLFDAAGIDHPSEDWTLNDMVSAASQLTQGDVHGLAMPVKNAYWWFGFQAGYGGSLFDENGTPTLDSNGSAEAMDWMVDLEVTHGVVQTGTQSESMKTQFLSSKAAMVVDGPWNWATYEAGRIPLQQSILPIVDSTGERVSPLVTYKGWSVSKQSSQKEWSVRLALHLSSSDSQREFALDTYTMPTHVDVYVDSEVAQNPVISGFLEQLMVGFPAPTTEAMSMVYDPLGTAFENVYSGELDATSALVAADAALESDLEGSG